MSAVREVEIVRVTPTTTGVLVETGVHLCSDNMWITERFAAPRRAIVWPESKLRGWVREMAEKRHGEDT